MIRLLPAALALLALVTLAAPAAADVTAFLGANRLSSAPLSLDDADTRLTKGFAIGFGLIIVGFEFEWAQASGDEFGDERCTAAVDYRLQCVPSLTTAMGNVLVQTPRGLGPVQLYGTVGAGGYRERYRPVDENDYGFGTNFGGGVKIELVGPLRLRVDYRVFRLVNDAFHETPQRLYVGANVAF